MPFCSFADNFSMYDITPVENLFIQEFMPHAPGDYVRVYLYGLMLCYHPTEEVTPADIARTLGMEESAVLDAYRYWERQGALTRLTDRPPRYAYLNLKAAMLSGTKQPDDGLYQYRDFNNSLQALFGSDRLLHPQEFQKAYEWIEELHLPPEVVLMMVSSQVEKRGKKFRFQSLEKMALVWADKGVRTPQEAEELLFAESKSYEGAQQVLRQLNIRRQPSRDEVNLMDKWQKEWGFSMSAILYACRETVKGRNPSFGYLDSILGHHRDAGESAQAMAAKLERQQLLDRGVKQVLAALGQRAQSPTDSQLDSYERWLGLGFDAPAILLTAEECARRNRATVEDVQRALDKWKELNLMSREAISQHLSNRRTLSNRALQVFEKCGLERSPTTADLQLIDQWLGRMPMEVILFGAECAAGTQLPMRYIDRLLSNWSNKGITTLEEARRERETRMPAARAGEASAPFKVLPGHQYDQREYKEGDLDYLYVDLEHPSGGEST